MRLRRLAAAAAGLLVLAPALAACGDDAAAIEVGDVIPARDDAQFVEGTASALELPLGRLEVFMGTPTKTLDIADTRQREATDAPEGATFVPITWRYQAGSYGRLRNYLGEEQTPTVELVSDKARYRLPAPRSTGEGSDSFYVPVSGSGKSPQLSVDYDGVTQTIDLASGERDEGRAAALYGLKVPKKRDDCATDADFHTTEGRVDFTCTVTRPARLPYANGQWATKGHHFLATTIDTTVQRVDLLNAELRAGGIYLAAKVASSFRFGDAKAVMAAEDGASCTNQAGKGCRARYHVVFDVTGKAARRLTVDQTYELTLVSQYGDFGGKKKMKLKVTAGRRLG